MNRMSFTKFMQLTTFSKPACDRTIYRMIKKNKVRSMIEVGLGDGTRAENMIRVAHRFAEGGTVRYTGIDLFEGREDSNSLSLISMHRTLKQLDAKTQLVPGEINQGIPRIANSHLRTDLIVISAGYEQADLEMCWFYIPRMIHTNSTILIQNPDGFAQPFQEYNRLQIEKFAAGNSTSNRIAA